MWLLLDYLVLRLLELVPFQLKGIPVVVVFARALSKNDFVLCYVKLAG